MKNQWLNFNEIFPEHKWAWVTNGYKIWLLEIPQEDSLKEGFIVMNKENMWLPYEGDIPEFPRYCPLCKSFQNKD